MWIYVKINDGGYYAPLNPQKLTWNTLKQTMHKKKKVDLKSGSCLKL